MVMNKLLDYFLLTNILLVCYIRYILLVCIEVAFMARNKYPEETVQLILSTAARLFVSILLSKISLTILVG